jgi:nucleotidyltransferase/DNA polymerase involved in DNA repair
MYCGENILWTKHPEEQNVIREKHSQGQNILWTKHPRDKMSSGTKRTEKKHLNTLIKGLLRTMKECPNMYNEEKVENIGIFSCIRNSKTYMML